MLPTDFGMDDLDEYNFRSDARDIGRRYRDDDLDDTREINDFIAHYANLLLHDTIAYDGKVTTTRFNENVIVTQPYDRNPAYEQSFTLQLRQDMTYAPSDGREYVNEFRNTIARYVFEVARNAVEIADSVHLQHATVE